KPADAKHFMLAQVRWLMSAKNGDLHAGLKLLAGVPAGIAVRATGLNATNEEFVPALAVAAGPPLNAPVSLGLPSRRVQPKRLIRVHREATFRVRLLEVMERGADFERVTYERAA